MRDSSLSHYENLWDTMRIEDAHLADIQFAAKIIARYMGELYVPAQARTGVPWPMFGLTHLRECSCDPNAQIVNGENWRHRTTLFPPGLGPWASWAESAIECAKRMKWTTVTAWSVPVLLAELEQHNGLGYAARGKESPYLWSFSQHGRGVGKFVADGHYDPGAVDRQPGCAPVLKCLMDWGKWTTT